MKLYIPTCTLNFNNIFSSESISPLGFYSRRGFGNKRFCPVCANNNEEAILLYSKYPRFKVEDGDLENYPMVIEIESEDYKEGYFEKVNEHDGVEVFACYLTINLNPFHCRIYFDGYPERQCALSKAEQSLENKFYKLYSPNFEVKPIVKNSKWNYTKDFFAAAEQEDFSWTRSYSECELKPNSYNVNLNHDVIVDRIKGFMYCYLIGANQSVSREIGRLKALSRKLCNTLSAVVNSPEKRPTQMQDDAILTGINEFNSIYTSIDEDSIFNKTLLKKKLADNPLNLTSVDAENLLKYWGVYDSFCNKIRLRRTYDAKDLWTCLEFVSSESLNRVTENMAAAVRRLEVKEITQREKYALQSLLSVDDNFGVRIIDDSFNHKFYQELINSQIRGEYKKTMEEIGAEEPLALAFCGGKVLEKMLGEDWETNPASNYIESLLNHFQENTLFDLFSSDVDALISFAAFCQKGDNIERLVEYLTQTGFGNYKLAYGIYGATRGFTSLPKTFTSTLINGNKEYYESVARYVWLLLNGVDLQNSTLPKQDTMTSVFFKNQFSTIIIDNISEVEPNTSKQKKVIEAVSKAVVLEDAVQSPKAFMNILSSFPNMTRTNAYKKLMKADFANDQGTYSIEGFIDKIYGIIGKAALKGQQDKIDTAIELEAKRQDSEAFLYILANFLDKSSNAYKKIAALIKTTGVSISKLSTQIPVTENRFSISGASEGQHNHRPINAPSASFVDDINASNFILSRSYLPNEVRDILAKKIISFQKDYAPNGYYSGREDSPRTNNNTIPHFINKCTYAKGKNPPWIPKTDENKTLLERLKQDLYDRYANR